jgi:hypothetical protein
MNKQTNKETNKPTGCNERFSERALLKTHIKTHVLDGHMCLYPDCNLTFTTVEELGAHAVIHRNFI